MQMCAKKRTLLCGLLPLLAVAALFLIAPSAFAADAGDRDPTFAGTGRVALEIGETDTSADSVAIHPDGSIVAVGEAKNGWSEDPPFRDTSLLILYSDGTPRAVVLVRFGTDSWGREVTIDPVGRIVIASSVSTGTRSLLGLARYSVAGDPDNTFGGDGTLVTDLPSSALIGTQSDARIVVVTEGAGNWRVNRFNTDGTPDAEFGAGGQSLVDFAGLPRALLVLPDDRIVVAGSSDGDVALARLTADGAFDAKFSDDGKLRLDIGGSNEWSNSLQIAGGGDLFVGGNTDLAGWPLFGARLLPDGTTDASYGDQGILRMVDGGHYGIVWQSDGKPVVGRSDMAVARYTLSGALDPTFGTNGIARGFVDMDDRATNDIAIQPDGKVVQVGYADIEYQICCMWASFSRYLAIGDPTPSATPTPTPTYTPIPFSDVRASDYFYQPVRYLTTRGAISGYADGTFRPYNNTTRAQVLKIVVLAETWPLSNPDQATFSDVPRDHPFYRYIETAAARGVISRNADGTFRPYNNVTRGQLAKIIVLAEEWPLLQPLDPSFLDVPVDNPFYREIETAVTHGIISGYDIPGGKEFRWFNNATRGQIAKIVYEALTE